MIDRHKYAFNGVCYFENAREHMETNDFRRIPIGRVGGIDGWLLTMVRKTVDLRPTFKPFIYNLESKPILILCYYSSIVKNDGSLACPAENSLYLPSAHGAGGQNGITPDMWLDEENGYLTNGGITIEYGFQIEAILSPENIWTFNFHDPLFDCQEKRNMISFCKENDEMPLFHCHKQLLTFHSTYFNSDSNENQKVELSDENLTHFNHFLQFSHGVSGFKATESLFQILKYSQKYKLSNVTQLAEQSIRINTFNFGIHISMANFFGLSHCLADLLREYESAKGLALDIRLLKRDQLEELSGETMKKCVKRFLEL
uniref:BTB domain-containing protein n=1 Tax=Caenorhabditis tropicalis TaxID=1561998 RepID=A0A1I7UKT2_9PELO